MTKEQIVKMIDERKKVLSLPFTVDCCYEICKEFTSEYSAVNMSNFDSIDIWQCIMCLICISNKNLSVDECNYITFCLKTLLNDLDGNDIVKFIKLCTMLDCADDLECIMEAICEEDADKQIEIVSKSPTFGEEMGKYFIGVNNYLLSAGADFYEVLDLLKNDSDTFFDVVSLVAAHRELKEDYEYIEEQIQEIEDSGINVKSKNIKATYRKLYKEKYYRGNRLTDSTNRINNYVVNVENEKKKYERRTKKEISSLDNALEMLERALKKDEITNAFSIVGEVKDPSICYAMLQLIDEHNKKYYAKLDSKLDELNKNTKKKYQALLVDYKIPIVNFEVEQIMHNSVDDVCGMLQILAGSHKIVPSILLKILKISNLDRVIKIRDYIQKGVLGISYVVENLDIYSLKSDDFDIFTKNIDILSQYGINPQLFNKSLFVLFSDSSLVERNLSVLKTYDLLKFIKSTDNYNFLTFDNLSLVIDKILELGFEKFLEQDLNILNSNNLKRLEALKSFNIPIDSLDELHSVLCDKKFFIKDEDLDSYILNVTKYKENMDLNLSDLELDSYNKGRVYDFGGVLISTFKVKRLRDEGLSLYDAIVSHTILSDDEYDKLANSLKQYVYKKQ